MFPIMEKKYASQYRNEGFLSGARRIYASLLDALILSVVSFCLFLSSSAIVGSVPSYSSTMETIIAALKNIPTVRKVHLDAME